MSALRGFGAPEQEPARPALKLLAIVPLKCLTFLQRCEPSRTRPALLCAVPNRI